MSYDIYIGETIWVKDEEMEEGAEPEPRVLRRTLREAPRFPNDEMTGQGNSRHPSYSAWDNFTRAVGLYDLFFDRERGLMRAHPGYAPLTMDHLHEVQRALMAWRECYPEAVPTFHPDSEWMDSFLARLMWLEWWMRWALAHCAHPALYNH